jgi:SAM-dependent methyltransferase
MYTCAQYDCRTGREVSWRGYPWFVQYLSRSPESRASRPLHGGLGARQMFSLRKSLEGILRPRAGVWHQRWILRRHKSDILNNAHRQLLTRADARGLQGFCHETRPFYPRNLLWPTRRRVEYGFLCGLNLATDLGLHTSEPLRILDIGCGCGYFVAATRALGHDCHGVDVPPHLMSVVEQKVYPKLLDIFECAPYASELLVQPFEPLPFDSEQYDLMTAFLICFNRHKLPDEWGAEEWRFFVEDALRCLRDRGRLFLLLNENLERYGDLRFYDPATLAYLQSVGDVDGARVTIRKERP